MNNLPKNWANPKVGDVINKIPISNIKLKQREYLELGKLPVIDQGQELVGGYTDNETLKIPCKLPVIVFGDHTKIFKYINFEFVAGADGIKILKPTEVFDPQLFFYFLKVIPLPNKGYARHFQFLEKSEIPLPPLPEQKRIVGKIEELFTDLDAGVEALKKSKALIKKYRQSVLKAAFEGKLTESWRNKNRRTVEPSSALLEEIRISHKENAKKNKTYGIDFAGFSELPKGWEWAMVADVSDVIHYGYTASSTSEPVGPKLLRITDIQDNSVNWASVPFCQIDNEKKFKFLLKEGDLVFARTGATVGKSFLLKGKFPETVFASYLIRVILSKWINKVYVYNYFQSNEYWLQIKKGQMGIGQPNVNAQVLSKIVFPLPPAMEQQKIIEEIEDRFSIADATEKIVDDGLKQAERLRQSILKKAFEGRLVPQDLKDEPAQKLLDHIKAQKAQAAPEKKRVRRAV
ncbi:MAG: restriction endonuclease subunit S [Elusimicrobia bacterium]|nr:restriction endonuclease subunit S [Elusimicrobiota bacterium]